VVERASSRLTDARFAGIGQWLRAGDVLVVNETRVRPARLMLRRPDRRQGRVPVRPARTRLRRPRDVAGAGKPAKHAHAGARLATADGALVVEVVAEGEQGERTVRVAQGSLDAVLRAQGEIPLPPYIHRPPTPEDAERYQTVYARVEGAVAAPTAGLHFSQPLLDALEAAGVKRASVTLHVGPGTFRPITADDPREHAMEEEWFEVGEEAAAILREARERGGRIVAVGTTSVRALESMADASGGGSPPRAAGRASTSCRLTRSAPWMRCSPTSTCHARRCCCWWRRLRARGCCARPTRTQCEERYRFYSYGDAMLVV
jgi:S-adenosylmethionine:tRNA ribosyltransferase-isomerase